MTVEYSGLTFSELAAEVEAQLRRPLAGDVTLAALLPRRLVNRAIQSIEAGADWRVMRTRDESLVTVAGNPLTDLPARWKGPLRDGLQVYRREAVTAVLTPIATEARQTSGSVAITPLWIAQQWSTAETAQGTPQVVCVDGESLRFGPTPDAEYLLTVDYFAYSARLSADGDRNWYTDTLEGAVIRIAVGLGLEDLGEPDLANDLFQKAAGQIQDQRDAETAARVRESTRRGPMVRAGHA